MTTNSFITLENTWRKISFIRVKVGVVEPWGHCKAACPTGLCSSKVKYLREKVLYTWFMADSVGRRRTP